jgi:hypothetical protein
MAVIILFDANKDGTIDEGEIKQASENLAKLDKNEDGKITKDDIIKSHEDYRPRKGRGDRGGPRDGRGRGPGRGAGRGAEKPSSE